VDSLILTFNFPLSSFIFPLTGRLFNVSAGIILAWIPGLVNANSSGGHRVSGGKRASVCGGCLKILRLFVVFVQFFLTFLLWEVTIRFGMVYARADLPSVSFISGRCRKLSVFRLMAFFVLSLFRRNLNMPMIQHGVIALTFWAMPIL